MLLKSDCQLIGAGGGLETAFDAFKLAYYLVYRHSGCKSGNALCVSGATANEFNLCNDVVLNGDFDTSRAGTLSSISECFFHNNLCILSVMYS